MLHFLRVSVEEMERLSPSFSRAIFPRFVCDASASRIGHIEGTFCLMPYGLCTGCVIVLDPIEIFEAPISVLLPDHRRLMLECPGSAERVSNTGFEQYMLLALQLFLIFVLDSKISIVSSSGLNRAIEEIDNFGKSPVDLSHKYHSDSNYYSRCEFLLVLNLLSWKCYSKLVSQRIIFCFFLRVKYLFQKDVSIQDRNGESGEH